jgi:CRISPR/Cas system CSM-associated protein Csm3 (group 7 of RAMP superfamily)
MKTYTLKLELLSPTLVGSGVGFGATIDTDVIFDELGIPFIPAKRVKGCLLDAAKEVMDMFTLAGIENDDLQIKRTFGETGKEHSAPVYFSNLYIEDYERNREWLSYFATSENYKPFVTPERVLNALTEVRQQTQIGSDGVAFEHSLRTIRVLRKGMVFYGDVHIDTDDEKLSETLLFACLNFRRFGTKRNRGFGEVHCSLLSEGEPLAADEKLEALCSA